MNSRIFPVLILLIAVGIFFVYVNPMWSGSITDAKAAIASDNQAITAANDYTVRVGKLSAARDAINPDDLSRLSALLPDSVDNVSIILNLNSIAARSGLSLSSINVTANSSGQSGSQSGSLSAGSENPVGSIDLLLSASGTYSALKTFLASVEKSERLLDVRDLVVNGSMSGIYTYQITLRLYWLH